MERRKSDLVRLRQVEWTRHVTDPPIPFTLLIDTPLIQGFWLLSRVASNFE